MIGLAYFKLFSLIVILFVFLFTQKGWAFPEENPRSPIILIPGDGGCQLEAKLDKPSVVHYFCNKKTDDYFNIWLNLELLVPYILDCWVDNMRLVYDNKTRTTSNSPGVDIRVPGFGDTFTVEWLDPSKISIGSYFNSLVNSLVDTLGYTRGQDILGAPYDFRKAPNELGEYYNRLKDLIVDNALTSGHPVTLVCHSLGCPTTLYFLNQQSQDWKDKNVKALVSLGAPWAGAVKAMKAIASGDNLGAILIRSLTVRPEQRTFPSLAFLLPSPHFWNTSEVILNRPGYNYTVADYRQFYMDLPYPLGWEMRKDTENLVIDLTPPGVEIHCLHGINVSTPDRLEYGEGKFPDSQPTLIPGNGDGTVNLRSLEACRIWQGKQSHSVNHQAFDKVDHMGILSDSAVIEYIKKVVS